MVLVFLLVRVTVFAFAYVASILLPLETRVIPPDAHLNIGWLKIWSQWDVGAYAGIAEHGYGARDLGNWAFLPFYPLLVRAATYIVPNTFAAGFLVSNLASLGAVLVLFKLAKLRSDDASMALRSVFYLLAYPSAFYMCTAYSESVFLLTAVACFYYLEKQRWLTAGSLGMLAAATRTTGVTLILPFVSTYAKAWLKGERRPAIVGGVVGAFLILVGLGLVCLILQVQTGDALAFVRGQEDWGRHLVAPWKSLWQAIQVVRWKYIVPGYEENWSTNLINLASTILFILLTIPVFRKLGFAYGLYMVAGLVIPLAMSAHSGDRPVAAMVRYTLVLFPAFVILADYGKRLFADRVICVTFVLFQGLLVSLFVRSWNVAGVS